MTIADSSRWAGSGDGVAIARVTGETSITMLSHREPPGTWRRLSPAVCAVVLLASCDEQAAHQTPPQDTTSVVSSAPSALPPPVGASSASAEQQPAKPLELHEVTFTSEVKNKEPADVLLAAEPGKRVWAHLRLRNRGDRKRSIHLEFRVNDDKRTTLDLQVIKSWSYRTWAYNTLLDSDSKGTVSLRVVDDEGRLLADTSVPIAGKARTKPYGQAAK
ncbi:MAG: hypothetical protein MUF54_11785 [Polyangiaceae bacterium]|jgi:hypothetical protein|nr:hypothetical protein [Polyangiaceae bacterium]